MELTNDNNINLTKALGVLELVISRGKSNSYLTDYGDELEYVHNAVSQAVTGRAVQNGQYAVKRVGSGRRPWVITNGDGQPIKTSHGITIKYKTEKAAKQKILSMVAA